MEICRNCGHLFREDNDNHKNPAEILGDLFQKSVRPVDDKDLCPACRKECGMLNLVGVGE